MKIFLALVFGFVAGAKGAEGTNLLLNSEFGFSAFDPARTAMPTLTAGSIPFWDQERYGDAEVIRSSRVEGFRPVFPVDGVVKIHPGKTLSQFALLSELGLDQGDEVSLALHGFQGQAGAVKVVVAEMRVDQAEGDWSPAEYGMADTRRFPREARGELIRREAGSAVSGAAGDFRIAVENQEIAVGKSASASGVIGLQVEFTNLSAEDVWIYAPCLVRGSKAQSRLPAFRTLPEYYRHLPRTMARLRRGEPMHIMVMGSSIDRGSANPMMMRYDEDSGSPTFKQPAKSEGYAFQGAAFGRPEWTPFIGEYRHFFSGAGRLWQKLLIRYDYAPEKLLLNFMACDGSAIGESHSALAEWSALEHAPDPETNGVKAGSPWKERYPGLFERPGGPGPDLVIFGSGANSKIDGKEEVAAFEGAIRWFQRHYPEVEFLFCMWNDGEGYTANAAMLKDLALHYGIPFLDLGRKLNLAARQVDRRVLVPEDGHPQAAAHYLWGEMLDRAFQAVDPMAAGIPQQFLPRRLSSTTISWEGEMQTYQADSLRLYRKRAFLLDETMVNLWALNGEASVQVFVDGEEARAPRFSNGSSLSPYGARDPRNSTFAIGNLSFGDQHIVEVVGAEISAVDAKTALNRRWHGVEGEGWKRPASRTVTAFASQWGAPYGRSQLVLKAGDTAVLEFVGTDASVAWGSAPGSGTLVARMNGEERLREAADQPVALVSGETVHMEHRKGILRLPFGVHQLEVEAVGGPVALLGAFSYDTRANRAAERRLQGLAAPGETVTFSAPYSAKPLVICGGGLKVKSLSKNEVSFTGSDPGSYEIVGE